MLTAAEQLYVLELARNLTKSPDYRYYSSQPPSPLSPPCVPAGVEGALQLLCVFFVLAALVFQGIISLWMAFVKRSRRASRYSRVSWHNRRPLQFVARRSSRVKKNSDKSRIKNTASVYSRRSQQQQQQHKDLPLSLPLPGQISTKKMRKIFVYDQDDNDTNMLSDS